MLLVGFVWAHQSQPYLMIFFYDNFSKASWRNRVVVNFFFYQTHTGNRQIKEKAKWLRVNYYIDFTIIWRLLRDLVLFFFQHFRGIFLFSYHFFQERLFCNLISKITCKSIRLTFQIIRTETFRMSFKLLRRIGTGGRKRKNWWETADFHT